MTSPTLAARALSRRFSDELAPIEVDLRVDPGEIVALMGLNGAGKPTLMRLLLGMLGPDTGTVETFSRPVRGVGETAWSRVGHLVGTPRGHRELTVRELGYSAARLQGCDRRVVERLTVETIALLELDHWQDRQSVGCPRETGSGWGSPPRWCADRWTWSAVLRA